MSRPAFDFTHLTVDDVSRHFGRRRALARVSLECRAGETLGLLGPNGAGKSTLIAILATILAPSSGQVRYGSATGREAGAGLRRTLGLLAHDLYLYPELTARENLEFFARLYGLDDPAACARAALARAGLDERGDELVSGFSRGMRQRLALERALVHHPRLVLLDEPFTGLDDRSSARLIERLADLKKDGCLLIVATHDIGLAEHVIDRAVMLQDGRAMPIPDGTGGLRDRYRQAVGSA
ncbi:MAG: ABC transporter ATP-binding protein [Acidobacteria bacterium]|nr:ABC transporter ATP-binding protein [Acidobacteriota bacterium]